MTARPPKESNSQTPRNFSGRVNEAQQHCLYPWWEISFRGSQELPRAPPGHYLTGLSARRDQVQREYRAPGNDDVSGEFRRPFAFGGSAFDTR